MLGEFKVSRCSRQCFAQERPLRDGEWYYSVIMESGDDYLRRDYSAEAWTEPPEGTIGWWKKRMPMTEEKKLVLAPPEVLIDLLRQMEHFPAKVKSRYLLALMLMRRRLVRPVSNSEADPATPDSADRLSVEVIADGSIIDVEMAKISRRESDSLRDELNELLYCEAVEDDLVAE